MNSDKIIIIDEEININKSEWIDNVEYTEPTEYEKNLISHTKTPKELIGLEQIETPIIIDDRKMFIEMAKVVALVQNGHMPLDNPSNMNYKEKQEIIKSMAFFVDNFDMALMKEKFNEICNTKLFTTKADFSEMTINPFINS
jgi:hypothetical protein